MTVTTDRRLGINSSTAIKAPCRVATTANITLSGEQTIDGVAVVEGDRVLVKNQTSGVDNGIYEVDTSTWQRAPDWDGSLDIRKGTLVYVHSGTANSGWWYVSTADTITIGTTSVTIAQASTALAVISAFVQTLIDDANADAFVQTLVAGLTAETSPATDDVVLLGDTSESLGNKMTLANMLKVLNSLTEDTAPDLSADFLLSYDASASAVKKIRPIAMPRGRRPTVSNGTDATNDIDFSAGEAVDSTGTVVIRLSSGITKRLDAGWAVGTNQGGLDTGAIANTTYHLFLIRRSDTGVVDAIFSTSPTSPTMPANYDQCSRRIASIVRAGATILAFTQHVHHFRLTTAVLDISVTNPGTSEVTRTLASVPTGVRMEALMTVQTFNSAAAENVYISETAASDQTPSTTVAPLATLTSSGIGAGAFAQGDVACFTNTSAQIRSKHLLGDANTTFKIVTLGWNDWEILQ